ncbi:MAG: hypothetical protein R3F20_16660 [Planctomycetota bacterium]
MRIWIVTVGILAGLVAFGATKSGYLFATSDEGAYVVNVKGMT